MSSYPPIQDVLPHRAEMILLDRIESTSDESIACSVKIRSSSPFFAAGVVPAVIATEYMAQCVAAFAGFRASLHGGEIRIGYLIGARLIELYVNEFAVDDVLFVKARRVWGDDALGRFECSVDSDGRELARAILTVFQGSRDEFQAGATS